MFLWVHKWRISGLLLYLKLKKKITAKCGETRIQGLPHPWFDSNTFAAPGGFSELGLIKDSWGSYDHNGIFVAPEIHWKPPQILLKPLTTSPHLIFFRN